MASLYTWVKWPTIVGTSLHEVVGISLLKDHNTVNISGVFWGHLKKLMWLGRKSGVCDG